jgi:hypothetical protein
LQLAEAFKPPDGSVPEYDQRSSGPEPNLAEYDQGCRRGFPSLYASISGAPLCVLPKAARTAAMLMTTEAFEFVVSCWIMLPVMLST